MKWLFRIGIRYAYSLVDIHTIPAIMPKVCLAPANLNVKVRKMNPYPTLRKGFVGKISNFFSLICYLTFLSSCKPSDRISNSETEAVMQANSKWEKNSLSVCWEFTSEKTKAFRETLRDTVDTAFEKTPLRFSGWQVCPRVGPVDIRIFIYDDPGSSKNIQFQSMRASLVGPTPGHPRVRFWGKNLSGQRAGVILSMTGENADPFFFDMLDKLSPRGRFNLLLSSSLHEFGHAIGLRHEDAHPKAECPKFDEDIQAGDLVIGPWNKTSFMERCFYRNLDYEKGIAWPNDLDVRGINTIYQKIDSDSSSDFFPVE